MATQGIDATLQALLACVCDALDAAEASVCTCSTTIGDPMIIDCCECQAGKGGELWGNFLRLYHGDRTSGADVTPPRPCAQVNWIAQYQFTLARCFPRISEDGEIPDADSQADAAAQLHADVATMARAIHCCTDTEPAYVETVNVISDPSGGCSFAKMTVRVPVSIKKSDQT